MDRAAAPLLTRVLKRTLTIRQRVGPFGGGRDDFALFAESGVYQKPLPPGLGLDGYLQGGVVGVKSRDLFIDGGLSVTRHVYRKFSAGFGLSGARSPACRGSPRGRA
jgi:hypothetical protein